MGGKTFFRVRALGGETVKRWGGDTQEREADETRLREIGTEVFRGDQQHKGRGGVNQKEEKKSPGVAQMGTARRDR